VLLNFNCKVGLFFGESRVVSVAIGEGLDIFGTLWSRSFRGWSTTKLTLTLIFLLCSGSILMSWDLSRNLLAGGLCHRWRPICLIYIHLDHPFLLLIHLHVKVFRADIWDTIASYLALYSNLWLCDRCWILDQPVRFKLKLFIVFSLPDLELALLARLLLPHHQVFCCKLLANPQYFSIL